MISIYVGNMPYHTTEADLVKLFSEHGPVVRATIVTDRETGRSRGYGFVEMEEHDDGLKAIDALAGGDFMGRPLTINEARPRGSGTGKRVIGDGTGGAKTKDHEGQPEPAEAHAGDDAPSSGYTNRLRPQHSGYQRAPV